MEGYNLSYLKAWIVIVNYLIGVFGFYKKFGLFLTNKFQNAEATVVSPLIQFILYCIIISISVWGMFPLIKDGFYKFKKSYFKEVFSILLVAGTIIGVIFIIVSSLGINISLNIMNKYEEKNILLTIFGAIVYAPVVEELVFRGAILNLIKFENKYLALFIIAIIFSFGHVKEYSFSFGSILYFVVYVILGFSFGVSYIYTKSILGAILNHLYWNSLTLLIMIIKLII
ncbi:CPBP family intramembrane glutamic endopeptidase [Clostridium sp. YIM B02551]|uniref:CPBP family intramembrane glutamic endopeptidase n=1 Tax=Clostridium sp. YIM B02551 TaxID=2910679 RepID=UPI001EEB4A95|nr:CPBP family intramembrane glutamic endopeptidase [Clostridium sp. YIM B02551]